MAWEGELLVPSARACTLESSLFRTRAKTLAPDHTLDVLVRWPLEKHKSTEKEQKKQLGPTRDFIVYTVPNLGEKGKIVEVSRKH